MKLQFSEKTEITCEKGERVPGKALILWAEIERGTGFEFDLAQSCCFLLD